MTIDNIVKVFIPSATTFFFGVLLTFVLNHYLYKYKMWKKKAGKKAFGGGETPIFNSLHKEKETGTPKMGGVVIWGSSILTLLTLYTFYLIYPGVTTEKLLFLSRDQTWIPFGALLFGGLVGLIDDFLEVRGVSDYIAGGLSLKKRLAIVSFVGLLIASWFYFKLEISTIGIPFIGDIFIGWLFIPLFIITLIGVYAGGVIDGLDGLAGGIFASIFAAYTGIAFYQDQINLAAFCAMIVGGILAFLWFNIPPARFYMSETGTMALTITLTVVAFLTDSVGGGHGLLALPIIAFPLVITTLSDILQVGSKKIRHKKIFKIAPLHHHFEAIGWPSYKVTMRYWVIGVVTAIIGLIIGVVG